MMSEVVGLTEERVILRTETPRRVGTEVELQVKLPEAIVLKSFAVNGTITDCQYIEDDEGGGYVLEVKIGDLSPLNEKILVAYKGFLERERKLRETRIELKAFQEAFDRLEEKLNQLRQAAELMRSSLQGTLELISRNAVDGKTTIH